MTWVPGEALLKRMWESVEKLGTGLLSPAQIRREGLARADVRRIELLNEATAQQDVADILAGRARLGQSGKLMQIQSALTDAPLLLEDKSDRSSASGQPQLRNDGNDERERSIASAREIVEQACIARDSQAFRRLLNIREAVRLAEDEAAKTTEIPFGADPPPISPDWLNDWKEGAERTSAVEIQRLWAKILLGETKAVGSFSLRTLVFLRTLDQEDAKLIEQIAPFVLNDNTLAKLDDNKPLGSLDFRSMLSLEDMGILSGATGLGLNFNIPVQAGRGGLIRMHKGVGILVTCDEDRTASFGAYALSRIGAELVKLGDYSTPKEYLEDIAKKIMSQGFKVSRVKYTNGWDGNPAILEMVEIAQ